VSSHRGSGGGERPQLPRDGANAFSPTWYELFLDPTPREFTQAELAFVLRHLPPDQFPELLDVCCGSGRHAVPLARSGYRVVGVDFNERVIEAAARAAGGVAGLTFVTADMRQLRAVTAVFPPFDGVVNLWQSFGFFDDDTNVRVLRSFHDALRPGGRCLLDVYDRRFHENRPTYESARRGVVEVQTRRRWEDKRLRVELAYGTGGGDVFEWRLYTAAELGQLAADVGFDVLLSCAGFEDDRIPDGGRPRMQIVLERPLD
jgi:SAM-dependent methyltransferase